MKCICQCEFCYECNGTWDEEHRKNRSECPKRPFLKTKEKKKTNSVAELSEYLAHLLLDAEKDKTLLSQCEAIADHDLK